MTDLTVRQQERAAWLVYHLGMIKFYADRIARSSDKNRQNLLRGVTAYREHGFEDYAIAEWYEVGEPHASVARRYADLRYTPYMYSHLRDAMFRFKTPILKEILDRVEEPEMDPIFAIQALKAQPKSVEEFGTWWQRWQDGDGQSLLDELRVLAGLDT